MQAVELVLATMGSMSWWRIARLSLRLLHRRAIWLLGLAIWLLRLAIRLLRLTGGLLGWLPVGSGLLVVHCRCLGILFIELRCEGLRALLSFRIRRF